MVAGVMGREWSMALVEFHQGEGGVWAQVHDVDGGYHYNLFHSMSALKLYVIHRVLVVRKRVLFRRKYIPLHRS